MARDASRVVRRQFKDVRVAFTSGPSLRDMLVRSSSCPLVCPREKRSVSQKKEKGRPTECRACDAGMSHRKCVLKGAVYSMRCTVCDDLYIGETGKPARERFAEHYRDAKRRDVRTAWGSHYCTTCTTWTGGESRQWLAINGLTCSMLVMTMVLMSIGFTA